MLWIGLAVTGVAGLVALTVVGLTTRFAQAHGLGSVSHQWIAAHRMDAPEPRP